MRFIFHFKQEVSSTQPETSIFVLKISTFKPEIFNVYTSKLIHFKSRNY